MSDASELDGQVEAQKVVAWKSLLDRTRQRDRDAIAEVLERCQPYIGRTVRGHLRCDWRNHPLVDWEDVTQQVSLMLLSGLERGKIRARTLSALRVLVDRLVRHELTKTRRWRTIRILAEHGDVLSSASRTNVNPN